MYFDRETQDRTIDFFELVKGLDIVERGTFDEKIEYCWIMYDVMEQNYLDVFSLRQVLKKSYTQQMVSLDQAIKEIKSALVKDDDLEHYQSQINAVKFFNQDDV